MQEMLNIPVRADQCPPQWAIRRPRGYPLAHDPELPEGDGSGQDLGEGIARGIKLEERRLHRLGLAPEGVGYAL
jgi:hypothetical protein